MGSHASGDSPGGQAVGAFGSNSVVPAIASMLPVYGSITIATPPSVTLYDLTLLRSSV